jgi:chorismate-pyruvate lyase
MINLSDYSEILQILMQTDGTVTELIKLVVKEDIKLVKLSEDFIPDTGDERILFRRILLQGSQTGKNWAYAESKIYLNNLPGEFVRDLLEEAIPIGILWIKYRMETFKQIIHQGVDKSSSLTTSLGFQHNDKFLSRTYEVFSDKKLIMEITEKFPINEYSSFAELNLNP